MSALRTAAQQALEALEWISDCYVGDDDDAGECASCHQRSYKPHAPDCKKNNAITDLRAALAQEQAEPVAGIIEPQIKVHSHQTLDEAMQQPRAMAQAYESGYNAGVANEREACAKVCEAIDEGIRDHEDVAACAAAIRARGNK